MPESLTDLAGLRVGADDFLAAVLEAAAQPIWVVDPDGLIRFANPAAIAALGYDRADELFGRDCHETIHYRHADGTPYPAADCPMLLPLATGETVARDLDWFVRRDGSTFPVSCVSVPIEMSEGRGAVVAFTNAEDRDEPLPLDTESRIAAFTELVATAMSNAQERAEVQRLADEQAALRRVATLVARQASPHDVLAAVAEEAGRVLHFDQAGVFRYDDDGSATLVADWGEGGPRIPLGTRLSLEGDSVAARVLRTGRHARIDDYANPSGPLAERGRRFGIRSVVGGPVVVDGRLWGAMVAGTAEGEPLPAGAESRIAQFTELVATAISNIDARSNLAASRARIVEAADEERRRVVRDLHDGAQQRLVHTIITLKLVHRALQPSGEPASELVSEALGHAERANVELRELAHGILPAVLTQGGLRAGVDALASRTPVPVEIDVPVGRLPTAIEATAYFVVAEALTNVAKHARAGHAEVTARIEDGTLAVQVRDDGVGGARPNGSGLTGLADRLAALDGRLRVENPPDGGALVAAHVPLPG